MSFKKIFLPLFILIFLLFGLSLSKSSNAACSSQYKITGSVYEQLADGTKALKNGIKVEKWYDTGKGDTFAVDCGKNHESMQTTTLGGSKGQYKFYNLTGGTKYRIMLNVPSGYKCVGNCDITGITVNANNKNIVKNFTIQKTDSGTCQSAAPEISGTSEASGKKNEWTKYDLTLKNNKCVKATYLLSKSGVPNGWNVKILNSNGVEVTKLKSVETSKNFQVKIKPLNAKTGDVGNIKITAKDAAKPTSLGSITLKLTVTNTTSTACTTNPDSCPSGQTCNPDTLVCESNSNGSCTVDPDSCPNGQTCNPDTLVCEATTTGSTQTLNFTVGLDDLGKTGDSAASTFVYTNRNPANKTRPLTISFYDPAHSAVGDNPVQSFDTEVTYDEASGKFKGSLTLDGTLPNATYDVKIVTDGYLVRKISSVAIGGTTPLNLSADLIAGDIDGSNDLTITDYNIILSCSIFVKTEQDSNLCNSDESYSTLANISDELNTDGDPNIDQIDLNYFIREFRNHPNGD